MWSIHVFGTLQCIVLAVQELLGSCVLYCMCRRATVCLGVWRGGVMVSVCTGVGK